MGAEYPIRDLSLHAWPLFAARRDSDVTSSGLQAALESIVRLSDYFGVGLGVQYAQLVFDATGKGERAKGADAGSVYLTQAAVLARATPLGASNWVAYLQVGVGVGEYVSLPECACDGGSARADRSRSVTARPHG